ncbi:MAG: hypothetical protein CL581_17385 [Alteromonadaceae bacterium]|nr:hypothetical protein [Alteromonadaceae bacterium]
MKLIDAEKAQGIVTKTWAHTNSEGKPAITTQTIQDAEPIMKRAKRLAQNNTSKDFRFAADIPANVVNDVTYQAAKLWGVKPKVAFEEILAARTDRSKGIWKTLLKGRDYRKFQAGNY